MDELSFHDRPMPPDAFPEIAPLIAAAKADGIDARVVLLRVLTDLFVGRKLPTRAELAQFVALTEPMIRSVDTQAAVAVARKLAAHPETPRKVIEALLARDDEASYEALRLAIGFDLQALDALAETGSRLVAVAIASRHELAAGTARILVDRSEATVDLALARRAAPGLPGDVVSLLVARARGNLDLAKLILAWPRLPFLDRCSLFLEAEPQERAAIATEATRRAFLKRARPSPLARQDIDRAIVDLGGANPVRLAEALAAWLGLSASEATAIVADSTGEALIIALRSCGARPAPIVTLLLRRGLHLSRSVERIFALDQLARETSGAAAAMILSAFARTRSRPTRHVAAPGMPRDGEPAERAQGVPRTEQPLAQPFKRRERSR
ncbi:Uncharacterized conserved protein, DUF2336 family [Rhizobiales bacterium GAS191]|nr:Uncharacterized conserved protein, DUF2336 family [Rhizobiales bacterium GAS191]